MTLTPELIEAAKQIFPFPAFLKVEKPTAKHKLFNQFAALYPNWPKIIFYILMDQTFSTALDGPDLGYKAEFDPELIPENLRPRT